MKSGLLAGVACIALTVTATFATGIAPEDIAWDDGVIEVSLSGVPGDPEQGLKVFTSRADGNCIACHSITDLLESVQFHGDVGPMLDGVGDRYSEAELRGIVADAKQWWPETMMFSFYKTSGFTRPGDGFTGNAPTEPLTTLLAAQQIEDLVAYLMTLKD